MPIELTTRVVRGGFALACMLVLSACSSLGKSVEKPTLSLTNVAVVEAGLLEQRYRLTLRVQNPNSFAIPIRGLSYAIKFAGSDFASGVTPNAFSVPAYGEDLVHIDVSTNLLRSAQQLMKFLNDDPDALDYELSGKINVDMPFVRPIPFTRSGQVALSQFKR